MCKFTILFVFTVLHSFLPTTVKGTFESPELVTFDIEYGVLNEALFYGADGRHTVVLVHQDHSTKETWDDFANDMRSRNIAAPSLAHSLDYIVTSNHTHLLVYVHGNPS